MFMQGGPRPRPMELRGVGLNHVCKLCDVVTILLSSDVLKCGKLAMCSERKRRVGCVLRFRRNPSAQSLCMKLSRL